MIRRVVNQIFRGSTAAPGEPARSCDSVFDGMRGFALEPRDFTSHFHQSLSNVPDFLEQATFVILFHSVPPIIYGSCRGCGQTIGPPADVTVNLFRLSG